MMSPHSSFLTPRRRIGFPLVVLGLILVLVHDPIRALVGPTRWGFALTFTIGLVCPVALVIGLYLSWSSASPSGASSSGSAPK
ncbi:MAG: hypothetical protein HOV80_02200 [Polyangiaceae bacterium]|nr:hypothetical protein [Polyangiaceae bacterium]